MIPNNIERIPTDILLQHVSGLLSRAQYGPVRVSVSDGCVIEEMARRLKEYEKMATANRGDFKAMNQVERWSAYINEKGRMPDLASICDTTRESDKPACILTRPDTAGMP